MSYDFKNSFKRFISSVLPNEITGVTLLGHMGKFNMHSIAYEVLKDFDNDIYEKAKISVSVYNKIQMNRIKTEFIRLNRAFIEDGLKVICFKGFAIDSDVYSGMGRIFTDNDFLCQEKDLPKILSTLEKLNYKYKQGGHYLKPSKIVLPLPDGWFQIGFHCNLPRGMIAVEIHDHLLPVNMGVHFNKDIIFTQMEKTKVFGETVYMMDIYNRIIFLMMHFLKDYRYQINWMMQGTMEHYVDVRKLYDIALLLDKYKIDWDIFKQLTKDMDIFLETEYVFRLFDFIFPGFLPTEIIGYYKGAKNNSEHTMCEYLEELLGCDIRKLMVFNIGDELREILTVRSGRTMFDCRRFNRTYKSMDNRIAVPVIRVNKYPDYSIEDIKLATWYNDNCIFFRITYAGHGNNLELHLKFVNPAHDNITGIIKNCRVNLTGDDEGCFYLYDYVTPIKSNADIEYKHEVNKNCSEVTVGLPWNILKLKQSSEGILFNAMISNINPGASKNDYILFGHNWDSLNSCGELNIV